MLYIVFKVKDSIVQNTGLKKKKIYFITFVSHLGVR